MAVKTSWAAGDVLLAADLTDTFGAKAPLASPTFTGNVVWSAATLRVGTASVATQQTTTSNVTYTDLATSGPAVTLTTGTKALVTIGAYLYNQTTGSNNAYMSFAVSGATTVAAADDRCLMVQFSTAQVVLRGSRTFLITGLTPGSNTFTAKYSAGAGTAVFADRFISVMDLGS